MPNWLQKHLQKKAPILVDPKIKLEAILAQAQTKRRKEKKPKVHSHLIVDASGLRTMQIVTPVMDKGEGFGYNILTINLGIYMRE